MNYGGAHISNEIQGESFRKLVVGENIKWRDTIYYRYYEYPGEHKVKRHYGIRTDCYKLIYFYYDSALKWELYDLEKDPSEMNNIYDDPMYLEVKKQMHRSLKAIRIKYKDVLNNSFM